MKTILDYWTGDGQPTSRSQDVPAHVKAINELWPIIDRTQAQTVIEMGCGVRPTAIETMLTGHGIKVTTLDCNAEADIQCDMHHTEIGKLSYDMAIARHSLEHCVAPYLAVTEMMRIAKWGLVVIPEDKDKWRYWRGHLSIFPRNVWEYMFYISGLRISYFGYGNFTGENETERNIEWRYLLERRETTFGPYCDDGRFIGNYLRLARRGWQ